MAPSGLLTDLYELNMAASYLERGMGGEATFSLFVRQLPPTRGFLVAAGLEPALEFLEGFGRQTGVDLPALLDTSRWLQQALDHAVPGMLVKAGLFPRIHTDNKETGT